MALGIQMSKRQNFLVWLSATLSGLISAIYVLSLKDLIWHPARDEELNATFQAFSETGILLVKHAGSGSYGAQASATSEYVLAGWDDDPGSFILASLLGQLTHSESPYPGLRLFLAFIAFMAGFFLPLLMVKLFQNPIAGYASLSIPFLSQIMTGSPLIGSQYGKSDAISTLPTYALYGIAGELVFLGLLGIVWLGTCKISAKYLALWTVVGIAFAGVCNLFRSNSGLGIAVGLGVLWAFTLLSKKGLIISLLIAVIAVVGSTAFQKAAMLPINAPRATLTGQSLSELPDSHNTWHALYLGLSWPQPISGKDSEFSITWSDEFGWAKAKQIDPKVVIASSQYDSIMKKLYVEQISSHPLSALELYVEKVLFTMLQYSIEILLIAAGIFSILLTRSQNHIASIRKSLLLILPTVLWGLIPAVMVMPMIYFFNELQAGIGLMASIAWIGIVISLFEASQKNKRIQ